MYQRWVHVDVDLGVGVCSECPRHITRWRRGERHLSLEVRIIRAPAANRRTFVHSTGATK